MDTAKLNILVFIDDDYATNFYHKIIVEESGVVDRFEFFQSPAKALDFFQQLNESDSTSKPDYIFLDINMPGMDGWQFLEKYKEITENPSSTIIMLSTTMNPKDTEKAEDFEIIHSIINKPLTVDLLKNLALSLAA